MGGLNPFECFLAGVAVASTSRAVVLFLALVSLSRKFRAVHAERRPVVGPDAAWQPDGPAADQRLAEVERRLSALERQARHGVA